MSEYLSPGVYVEEVSFQPSQIQPASTSVAAIVGPARFGPVRGRPQLLTSYSDYTTYFGDAEDLTMNGQTVTNYTAYAARAFFDNGGQQLYLARIVNDMANEGLLNARAATATLSVPATNPLVNFTARFPGSGGNVSLLFQPRRSQRLLQFGSPAANNTVILKLTNVPATALSGSPLPASAFPLQSVIAIATAAAAAVPPTTTVAPTTTVPPTTTVAPPATTPASTAAPPATPPPTTTPIPATTTPPPVVQYTFTSGQIVIYTDRTGQSHTVLASAFATAISAAAVTATGSAQSVTLPTPAGAGSSPLYSIPVGTNMRYIFGIGSAVTTLYGTGSGNNITLPASLNPGIHSLFSTQPNTDITVPLAVFAMGSRNGDGNVYHDIYDIAVQINGLTTYTFPGVYLEQDSQNSLAAALIEPAKTVSAFAAQPVDATYFGTVSVAGLWAAMLQAFVSSALHPTDPAVAPAYILQLAGGTDGNVPAAVDYAGAVDEINGDYGIAALESVDQISIVLCPAAALPNPPDPTLQQAVVSAIQAHCTKMLYRVGVIDSPKGAAVEDVQEFAGQFSDTRLALYYPWIYAASLNAGGGQILLPPSGFVAGVYAYTDLTRGVQKAPANEVVQDALGLELYINKGQQDILNPLGINCIRRFPTQGIRIWGARTLSADPQWQYVNVRRYFLYLEHSIADSTNWVVFEPNGQALWASVAGSVGDFLYSEWFAGRLFGATPAAAYFVRCDQTTMTQADLDNGRLICVIGVAPLEPAEFVIFRIGQWTATAGT